MAVLLQLEATLAGAALGVTRAKAHPEITAVCWDCLDSAGTAFLGSDFLSKEQKKEGQGNFQGRGPGREAGDPNTFGVFQSPRVHLPYGRGTSGTGLLYTSKEVLNRFLKI